MITPGLGEQAIAFVSERIGVPVERLDPCIGIGLTHNGELVGGFVFRNWRGHDVEISFALDNPRAFTREVPRKVFKYVFEELGCARCTALVRRGNRRSRKLVEGVGFKLEGKARLGYDGRQDMMIYGMLAKECRWLEQ